MGVDGILMGWMTTTTDRGGWLDVDHNRRVGLVNNVKVAVGLDNAEAWQKHLPHCMGPTHNQKGS